MNTTVPNLKEEIKRPLPKGWRRVSLGEVCKVQGGFAFRSEDYQNQGFPIIRISNIIDGYVKITDDTVCVAEKIVSELEQFRLFQGDILIAMSGATTGKVGYVQKKFPQAYLNQRVGRLKPDEKEVDINYLYLLLRQPGYLEKIFRNAFGSAIPNVSPGFIESLEVFLPPLPEQKRIAAILNEQIAAVEKARAAAEAQLEAAQIPPRRLSPVCFQQFRSTRLATGKAGGDY